MIGSCRGMLLALAAAVIAFTWVPAWAQPAGDGAGGVVAKVGEEIIRLEEVEKSLSAQLAQLEQQRFQLLQQRLDQLIAERLLAQEARRRSTSVDQLLRAEVDARAPQVTDDDVTDFMNQNRSRLPPGDEADLRLKVRNYLRAQRLAQERQAYVDGLRQRTEVAVFLEESAPTRVPVSDKGFARGPADAPVVIVELGPTLPRVAPAPRASSGNTTTSSSSARRGTSAISSGSTRPISSSIPPPSPSAWTAGATTKASRPMSRKALRSG